MALLIVAVGVFQSWTVALAITNLALISAIMALGVNIQWGYAGLFNVGIMGFAALGGVACVLVSMPPDPGRARGRAAATSALTALAIVGTLGAAVFVRGRTPGLAHAGDDPDHPVGYAIMRIFLDPASRRDRGRQPRGGGLPRRPRPADPDLLGGRRPLRRRRPPISSAR
jgi:branched-chain amino acid transport system permease protein